MNRSGGTLAPPHPSLNAAGGTSAPGIGTRRSGAPSVSGPIRFARYAYGPNALGYCGPDQERELFDQATLGREDAVLRSLAARFEGAFPYLELIARSAGIRDPLDARVVEAYWLGNPLLDRVRPAALGTNLEERFRPRVRAEAWRWLATKPDAGAVPNHAFHVLDVFPVVGLMRGDGQADKVLRIMDSCRIRWARVVERDGDWLVVNVVPLDLVDGRLALVEPRIERVRGWRDGVGFLGAPGDSDVAPGDVVSLHWDWACERLDDRSLSSLQAWTRRELELANRTI